MLVAGAAVIASACAADPPSSAVGLIVVGCGPGTETGSGALVAPDLVLTSAHVVAGATTIDVYRSGWSSRGEVVAFDDDMDLAYVRVDHPADIGFSVTSDHVEPGDEGVAYVFRSGDPVTIPVTIGRRVTINTEDIYVEGDTARPGFVLDVDIEPGYSGGPVVVDGSIVGIIWARSRTADDRAYAIDPDRAGDLIDEQLATGTIDAGIDPSRCRD